MSTRLLTEPRISDPDDFYARLIALHDGLTTEQSHSLNCKLLLLLANHIGDREILDDALAAAARQRP